VSAKPRIGFIGIGLMGEAFTRRLLDRAWSVTVWNLEPERLDKVAPYGALIAKSPRQVAESSDIVCMCVYDASAVANCVFGSDGVSEAAGEQKLIVDFSTCNPEATREMAARLYHQSGFRWIDAPVSGGPPAARAGTLTIMAGGACEDIEKIQALIADVAANFTRMGEVGAGQTTKIINQAVVGVGFALIAEAVMLAERSGIEADLLINCLSGGLADSNLLRYLYPQMRSHDFDPPRAYARQLYKDLKNVHEFASGLGLALPVVDTATAQYRSFVGAGNEMADPAAIVDHYPTQAQPPSPEAPST